MDTNETFSNMDGSSADAEDVTFDIEPSVKSEEMTIEEHIIEEGVEGEIVCDKESSLRHHLHPILNYSGVNNLNLQEEKVPTNVCIKQEYWVKQGELDLVLIKKEDESEDDCCQKSEHKLTSELDIIENSIVKKFENPGISSGENKSGEIKCEVSEHDCCEISIKIEHDENNQVNESGPGDYGTEYEQALTCQHENIEMFQCASCGYKTKWKGNLRQHIKIKHDANSETLKCGFCEYATKYRSHLNKHIKAKHDENCEILKGGSCKLKCEFCEFTTKLKSYLTQHIKAKHDLNSETFKCGACEYKTKWKGNLMKHIKIRHDGNSEILKCGLCEYATKYRSHLNEHIKMKHDENCEILKCGSCDYTTKLKCYLKRHVRRKHDLNSETFKCKFCKYTTKNKQSLKQHITVKHDENCEILKCGSCEYTTKLKYRLTEHNKTKHDLNGQTFKFEFCEYKTSVKHNLSVGHVSIQQNGMQFNKTIK